MKRIRTKLFAIIISIVVITQVLVGGVTAYLNYNSTLETLENSMNNIAKIGSDQVKGELEIYKTIAFDVGMLSKLTNPSTLYVEKSEIYKQRIDKYGLLDIYIADKRGAAVSNITGKVNQFGETAYFNASMNGEVVIAPPSINEELNKLTCRITAPLWKDGEYNAAIEGVIIVEIDVLDLSQITSGIKVGKEGYGFIVDKEGYVIAHPKSEKVLNRENIISNYEKDGTDKELSEIVKEMKNGNITFGTYTHDGVKSMLAYSSIEGIDGWGFFESTPLDEYMQSTYISLIVTAIMVLISVVIAVILAAIISNKISKPIKLCADRLELLAQGDLHTEVPITTSKDETGMLLESLKISIDNMKAVIGDISYHLGAIANGDFSNTVDREYEGDLDEINISTKKIIEFLNDITGQIDDSAEQVASGSEQVAGGAQALSQGAAEQASSIEELAATFNEISEQIKANAKNAENARTIANDTSKEVENGSNQMQEMLKAMEEISKTSNEIGKIIKTIEDIAFQTNILALNAAVEAARAGIAGKGFAVVADEVRNLASKSAEAAKNTTELIENSLKVVKNGSDIADRTEESLKIIVEKTNMTTDLIEEISDATQRQAMSASQVTIGVEQISSVVQTNSATAEESAASSEELSGQSQILKNLVGSIKLKDRT